MAFAHPSWHGDRFRKEEPWPQPHKSQTAVAPCADVPGCQVHDRGRCLCGIVSFSVAEWPATAVKAHLQREGVAVFNSRASSTLLDFQARA